MACEDVIGYTSQARLKAIEWHGINHVPHGDLDTAGRIMRLTLEAELSVAAYGSYYVVGQSENQGLTFATVLDTAEALNAPLVRVWAGNKGPESTSPSERAKMSDQSKRISDMAAEKNIKLVFEYHSGTLTQTGQSCSAFMESLDHPNAGVYWQPAPELDVEQNLAQLRCVLPWLSGLHVFHWGPTHLDRHPLEQGLADWNQYLELASQCDKDMNVLLEFVKGGTVGQFNKDAATLHELLK